MPAIHNNQPLEKALTYMMSQQSNQPSRYMAELDVWTDSTIIKPLFAVWQRQQQDRDIAAANEAVERAIDEVKKEVRTKVLDSYRNGQKAGPRKVTQRGK